MKSHELAEFYEPVPKDLKDSLVGKNYDLPEFEQENPERLKGFRVALVTSHGPELPEFHVPLRYLRDRGASVEVITPDWIFDSQKGNTSGLVVLAQFLAVNLCAKADKTISNARIEDYDAVVILGGAWNPIVLRTDSPILRFIREAHDRRTLIAAICHGPQVLISSKAFPAGTQATGTDDIQVDLTNAGFAVPAVKDKSVVYDETQQLITSPSPEPQDLKAFCEEIGKHAQRVVSRKA